MNADGSADGVEFAEWLEWLDKGREQPANLHVVDHGALQWQMRVGTLDVDPLDEVWPLRVIFGLDRATDERIALCAAAAAAAGR